jgi:alginate O-acetyltransferase complex protein AlgI
MLFNSLHFLLFFPIVTVVFFLLPHKYRWLWLLGASCFFYMFFKPIYILILFFTIIIDYFAGIWIENAVGPKRKQYLLYSLIANIGVLAVFKYYNFLNGNIDGLASLMGLDNPIPYLEILLPVGLSFHTFQAMSYTIEVYRGNQKAEKHFGIYSLYVMFYPQLVAGPIERPQNIIHQFYEEKKFEYERVVSGLRLMLWGMFKKVVIADQLARVVNLAYDTPNDQNGITWIVVSIFFSIQIYCDFSGYSDIAIGSARVMGYDLMRNFNIPYISTNIKDFWQRWHISLSSWFRDYLYIPLGGSRNGNYKLLRNIFITFVISGLWHGANWTFVVWGSLNGIAIILFTLYSKRVKFTFPKWISIPFTFGLVTIFWIFFRADSIQEAIHIINSIFTNTLPTIKHYLNGQPIFLGFGEFNLFFIGTLFLAIFLLYITDFLQSIDTLISYFKNHSWLRWTTYFILVYGILFFGFFGETAFIYFQF